MFKQLVHVGHMSGSMFTYFPWAETTNWTEMSGKIIALE